MNKKKLLLFDIDGTLLRPKIPSHFHAFDIGFKKIFNVNIDIYNPRRFDGQPDKGIIFEVLEEAGLKREYIQANIDRMFNFMTDYVRENIKKENVVVLGGVKEILEELKSSGFTLGVLTGNLEGIAKIKLDIAGLKDFFSLGSYGSESEKRCNLVEIANEKAYKILGYRFPKTDIYNIGDTVRDITCGKEAGIKTIGVATGLYGVDVLKPAGADLLLKNLQESEKLISFINS